MFRVKIVLLSVLISGSVLVGLGLYSLSIMNKVGMGTTPAAEPSATPSSSTVTSIGCTATGALDSNLPSPETFTADIKIGCWRGSVIVQEMLKLTIAALATVAGSDFALAVTDQAQGRRLHAAGAQAAGAAAAV